MGVIMDITKPLVSKVASGVMGKNILIYGEGGTGKTSNAIKAPDCLVLGFESGLSGLAGVRSFPMKTWQDFQQVVKLLVLAAAKTDQPLPYKTIVIDGVDHMGVLAEKYMAGLQGVGTISAVNNDAKYSIWRDYSTEIDVQVTALQNSPYTVIWIDHSAVRKQKNAAGEDFDQVYPAGDIRVADKIYNSCDVCAYTQLQPSTADGKEVLSTIFFHAGNLIATKCRYRYITSFITEWDFDKLSKAIDKAITDEAAANHTTAETEADSVAETRTAVEQEISEAVPSTASNPVAPSLPISDLIVGIGGMLKDMMVKKGNINEYNDYRTNILKKPTFSCKTATEQDRSDLELVYNYLKAQGYNISTL